ncbi:MAG: Nif3-like dinuclear metal center hexameric protein [Candidatus Woesearchaeota archaeon]
MAELRDVCAFLNKELVIKSVSDYCVNGLQFSGKASVSKIAFVVDITCHTIQKAIEEKCNMIISHHALIWKPPYVVTGVFARRLKLLAQNDISVYTAHLPMDIHKKYSHGRIMADMLRLYSISPFGYDDEKKVHFGVHGNVRREMPFKDLADDISKKLGVDVAVYNYGKENVSSIGIVSGGGGFAIEEAFEKGLDCFMTGEMKEDARLIAKDYGVNVIVAGHYETEQWGMKRLALTVSKKLKVETLFIPSH